MGKISPVSSKYIVNATIDIDGVVDRPDVIGAIFGQTEGLLGSELELRELQRSGRIGRIEVQTDVKGGKTKGNILIPSSLDKAETSIVAAALEIIERIGPCNAKIMVSNIEDVRISKRNQVVERAKELLRTMMDGVLPDSQELADEVAQSVRIMEVIEYGKDRLPAGPSINDSDEVVVVEGRADVVNLLKHGFKNAIAMNGTSVPETIIELSKKKVITVFVDGDRGGNLILKEVLSVAEIDYVTRASDGKEVEEITKKEIHKALRSRITGEQAKFELAKDTERQEEPKKPFFRPFVPKQQPLAQQPPKFVKKPQITPHEKTTFREILEDLVGTRAADLLNKELDIIGKIPVASLATALANKTDVYAIIFDGIADKPLVDAASKANVQFLIAMDSQVKPAETSVNILTVNDISA